MTRLVASELVKLRTVRLPVWLLGAALALAGLLVFVTVPSSDARGEALTLHDDDLLARVTGVGMGGAEVLMLVLGVLCFTQELRFGTATPTFLISPARARVVVAKLCAIGVTGAAFGVVTSLVSMLTSAALIDERGGATTWNVDVLKVLIGAVAATALYGALGVALGALLHNQIAAVVGSVIWLLVVEQLLIALIPAVTPWTLAGTTAALVQLGRASTYDNVPSTWAGGLLLLTYVAAAAALAAAVTIRRDFS